MLSKAHGRSHLREISVKQIIKALGRMRLQTTDTASICIDKTLAQG